MELKLCPFEQKVIEISKDFFKYLFTDENRPLRYLLLLSYVISNIIFYTRSFLLISTILSIFMLIVFRLWIRTVSEFLSFIILFTCSIYLYSVYVGEKNYIYIINEVIAKKTVDIPALQGVSSVSGKFQSKYLCPLLEGFWLKIKEDLFFVKKPFLVTKAVMKLNEDITYPVRPVYIVLLKNIGNQTVKINKIDWIIYSKRRGSPFTSPDEWRKSIGEKPLKLPMLFPQDDFFIAYGPDPAAAFDDEITLTLTIHYKNLKTEKEDHLKVTGKISYDGTESNYYRFNFKKVDEVAIGKSEN